MSDPNLPSADDVRGILKPYMEPDSPLERRAEEQIEKLRAYDKPGLGTYPLELMGVLREILSDSAQVIEELLSENRQVRESQHESQLNFEWQVEANRSLRQDLDRINAEREAYRKALKTLTDKLIELDGYENSPDEVPADPLDVARATLGVAGAFEKARRILAENDR